MWSTMKKNKFQIGKMAIIKKFWTKFGPKKIIKFIPNWLKLRGKLFSDFLTSVPEMATKRSNICLGFVDPPPPTSTNNG